MWSKEEADSLLRSWSPGILSGRLLAVAQQVESHGPEVQELFQPIQVTPGVTMYRYKYAVEPYKGRTFNVEGLDVNDMHEHFMIIVNHIMEVLNEHKLSNVIFADEDEDFTYGAFCTAIATIGFKEYDWLLDHVTGNMYTVRHISLELEEDDPFA